MLLNFYNAFDACQPRGGGAAQDKIVNSLAVSSRSSQTHNPSSFRKQSIRRNELAGKSLGFMPPLRAPRAAPGHCRVSPLWFVMFVQIPGKFGKPGPAHSNLGKPRPVHRTEELSYSCAFCSGSPVGFENKTGHLGLRILFMFICHRKWSREIRPSKLGRTRS